LGLARREVRLHEELSQVQLLLSAGLASGSIDLGLAMDAREGSHAAE
tara:strand:+ start:512 stop:652 length:141 start_codon:yes stop_codon:yes gene_type:complete